MNKLLVVAEVTLVVIPRGWLWGVLCGVEEEARLFAGCPVNLYAMPEGAFSTTWTISASESS